MNTVYSADDVKKYLKLSQEKNNPTSYILYAGFVDGAVMFSKQLSSYVSSKYLEKNDDKQIFRILIGSGTCNDIANFTNTFESYKDMLNFFKLRKDLHSMPIFSGIIYYHQEVVFKLKNSELVKCGDRVYSRFSNK